MAGVDLILSNGLTVLPSVSHKCRICRAHTLNLDDTLTTTENMMHCLGILLPVDSCCKLFEKLTYSYFLRHSHAFSGHTRPAK